MRINTVLCDAQRMPIRIGSQTKFATVGRGHQVKFILATFIQNHNLRQRTYSNTSSTPLRPYLSSSKSINFHPTCVDKKSLPRILYVGFKFTSQISSNHEAERYRFRFIRSFWNLKESPQQRVAIILAHNLAVSGLYEILRRAHSVNGV